MAKEHTWLLTDQSDSSVAGEFSITPADLGIAGGGKNWKCSKRILHGGLSEGVEVVEIDNGDLAFTVVPTRGMGILKGTWHGLPIGWCSPVRGPVHPQYVNLTERGGLGWLKGFDEWVVRCGLEWNGAPGDDQVVDNNGNTSRMNLTLHGRIANLPAGRVELKIIGADPAEFVLTGIVEEAMLFGPKLRMTSRISTTAGASSLHVTDVITNFGDTPQELELLYHCNYGTPFLESGSCLVAAAREIAPRDTVAQAACDSFNIFEPPTPGFVEQVFWYAPLGDTNGDSEVLLKNRAGDKAAGLQFNVHELPCFTLWKHTGGLADGYVTGLEPGTNYPNRREFERTRGRVSLLQPGESRQATLIFDFYDSPATVCEAEERIHRLQSRADRVLHRHPISNFSPV